MVSNRWEFDKYFSSFLGFSPYECIKGEVIYILENFGLRAIEGSRSLGRAWPNRWGVSLNPSGRTIQVNSVTLEARPSKPNRYLDLGCKRIQEKKTSFRCDSGTYVLGNNPQLLMGLMLTQQGLVLPSIVHLTNYSWLVKPWNVENILLPLS